MSKEYLPQNMSCVADKSAHLFVDLPAMNGIEVRITIYKQRLNGRDGDDSGAFISKRTTLTSVHPETVTY